MRLTGIIDYAMDNFLCVRGFASMLELSEISKADEKIQRGLKMEQNIKVIIESEQAFDDDTLINAPSFGENYFLTRQIVKHVDLSDYPFLKMFIAENKFTYFVEVIKLLLEHDLIKRDEEGVHSVLAALKEIEDALRAATIVDAPNDLAVRQMSF